ncbi:hypothetical protein [Rhizobium chutanense]|uniref:Uncharacterized protein n=1 Tax=Rhizobium chutanense TaxID=2035448 RepID=A0A3S0SAG3_9HYPH|nr:hypothetical protein [Rhizobium chutanense]RUM02145.1 hypothetical protein EFR84_21705 [Rhizobium chutanense]
MQVVTPEEAFPHIATVGNPAAFFDGYDAFLCYEASVQPGGGNVVLKFADVIDFRITPMNVEGLRACRYPVKPWAFNEIVGSEEAAKWKVFNPRLWLISFQDITIEVLFETVSFISLDTERAVPQSTLIDVVNQMARVP